MSRIDQQACGRPGAEERYPRVLIITVSRIHQEDQLGLSLRQWFADWPRQRLAQLYSGGEIDAPSFAAYTFRLGAGERRLGRWLFLVKASTPTELRSGFWDAPGAAQDRSRGLSATLGRYVRAVERSGLWELLCAPRLSTRLMSWIEDFRPEVIYCQGYNLGFAWLPLMVSRAAGVPIVFQTGDDWPAHLYEKSPAKWIVRPLVERAARRLVGAAKVRLTNGPTMAAEYSRRYGGRFEQVMMCDRSDRIVNAVPERVAPSDVLSIVYTGSLTHDRWRSIADVARALNEYRRVQVSVFASRIPPEAGDVFSSLANVVLRPPASHELLPSVLRGADILLLAEPFDEREADEIALSISTKAHLYMAAQRPILVYGSGRCGVVQYAKTAGWGRVLSDRDPDGIRRVVDELANEVYVADELAKARDVFQCNHDDVVVREDFRRHLLDAAKIGQSVRS